MKKLLFFLSFVLLVICFSITAFAAYLGDVNNDGKVTAGDARIVLRVSAKLDNFNDSEFIFADIDKDEKITASDARKVLRMSAKLDALQELTTKEPSTEDSTEVESTTSDPVTEPSTEATTEVSKKPVIKADKEKIEIYNGTSKTVNITIENAEEHEITVSLGNSLYGAASSDISYNVTNTETGVSVELKVNEVFIGSRSLRLSVEALKPGDLSSFAYLDIPVTVLYSDIATEKGLSVKYMGNREFLYDEDEDKYILRFGLMTESQKFVDSYGRLDLKIVNDDDEVVYSTTYDVTSDDFIYWSNAYTSNYLFTLYIPADEIISGETEKGKVYFSLITPWILFNESELSVSNLPEISILDNCSVELPETPIELSRFNYKGTDSKFRVDDITYEFEENYDRTVDLKLYFSGEKTFDDDGNNISASCYIAYKLYDAEGYVVKSGTAFSDTLKVGEKQKNITATIYNLDPGKYTLELLNYG